MADVNYLQFGYTEMYEWAEIPLHKFGMFVQFDDIEPAKITRYHTPGAFVAGVSTICSETISDDPDEWRYAYAMNDVGDVYMRKERLAVGIKQYDEHKEISYVLTKPWEHYIKINTEKYNPKRQYNKRSARNEWVKVNLMGKCIVYDDGTCQPGDFCTPYAGPDKGKWGHAVKSTKKNESRYYVLSRISDTTIMIVNK